jgi:hypothetical protein
MFLFSVFVGFCSEFVQTAADFNSRASIIVALPKSSTHMSRSQNFEEVFNVIFVVIKMGSDSYRVSPDADKNLGLLE